MLIKTLNFSDFIRFLQKSNRRHTSSLRIVGGTYTILGKIGFDSFS